MKFNEIIIKILIISTIIFEIISLKKKKRDLPPNCIKINEVCERTYNKGLNTCCQPATCVNWKYDTKIRGWGYFDEKNKKKGTCQILVRRRRIKKRK